MQESKKKPEALVDQRKRIQKTLRKRDAIEHTVSTLLWNNKPIYSIGQVQTEVQSMTQLEVDKIQVRQVLRKDLHMGYRMVRTVTIQANSERCLVLR